MVTGLKYDTGVNFFNITSLISLGHTVYLLSSMKVGLPTYSSCHIGLLLVFNNVKKFKTKVCKKIKRINDNPFKLKNLSW